jgi:hypothetical protein
MKCKICDCILTDEEAIRKHAITHEYMDICTDCMLGGEDTREIPIEGDISTAWLPEFDSEEDYV